MKKKDLTIEAVLRCHRRIVAHLVAESLGYFTPRGAANAILHYLRRKPFACEWYSWIGFKKFGRWPDDEELIEIGASVLNRAIRNRAYHRGYMASYARARALVEAELKAAEEGRGPVCVLASWF